ENAGRGLRLNMLLLADLHGDNDDAPAPTIDMCRPQIA
ncbi:two-component sensor histidine kinase, partial [Pseudomonas sp. FW306-2-2C-A10BC]